MHLKVFYASQKEKLNFIRKCKKIMQAKSLLNKITLFVILKQSGYFKESVMKTESWQQITTATPLPSVVVFQTM